MYTIMNHVALNTVLILTNLIRSNLIFITLLKSLPLILSLQTILHYLTIIYYEIVAVVNAPATRLMTGIIVVVASSVHITLEEGEGDWTS